MLNIVIPMAGSGKRFLSTHDKPKPLIDVMGKAMVDRVLENLTPADIPYHMVCVTRRSLYSEEMAEILARHHASVVLLETQGTPGAAFTVNAARGVLQSQLPTLEPQPIVVASSDQLVDCDMDRFYHACLESEWDGVSMTFESVEPFCSFCRVDNHGRIISCAEKEVISNHANVGIYFFRSWEIWDYAFRQMVTHRITYNGEYYVAPLYNFVYSTIYEVQAEKVHLLGTPELLEAYIQKRCGR